jgi:hypothetical protein
MRDSWRHFAAEFIGTFALVFVAGASIMAGQQSHSPDVLLHTAIAQGLILALMITATMRISGHLNPAVTLGFLVTRRIEPVMAVIHIIAQLFGAVVAAYALKAIFPPDIAVAARLGGTSVAIDLNAGQAILCEFIATFFLTGAEGRGLRDRTHRRCRHPGDRDAHGRLDESRTLIRPRGRQRHLRGAVDLLGRAHPGRRRCGTSVRQRLSATSRGAAR